MNRTQRQVVLLSLIDHLRQNGSWCGETHIQKSAYFLQELLSVPLDLNVIFYKHGPYSFDLSDEITALRSDQLLSVLSREPYGPSLLPTEQAARLLGRFPITLNRYGPAIRFVAERLGMKTVVELERLATLLYVVLERPEDSTDEQAAEILRLKPHVSMNDARAALQAVKAMRAEVEAMNST